MTDLLDRNKLLLIKIESSEGVDAAPSASADAILTENIQVKPPTANVTTNEHTGSLDTAADIPVGSAANISWDMYLKGAGTAGTAPEVGVPLQITGMAELLTAADVGAPTAATDGTATTLTLPGATFSGAAGAYQGMPAILTGNPATAFDTLITDHAKAASTPVVTFSDTFSPSLSGTTLIAIKANALYYPISTAIKSATIWVYLSGLLYKFVGCRGDHTFKLDANGQGMFSFNVTGILASKSDASVPTATFPGSAVPKIVFNNRNGQSAFLLDRSAIATTQFSIGMNNGLVNPPNPNQTEGIDPAVIIKREVRGTINPKATLVATRDTLAQYRNATTSIIALRAGRSLGNRFGLTVYTAQFSGYGHENQGGIIGEALPFKANGVDRTTMAYTFY